jgi:hypothetical protein
MIKNQLFVPENVEYISDWEGFTIPQDRCIIDKVVTGCGFTEWCIRNNIPMVICSPRKILLENKEEQHKDDPGVLYLKNEAEPQPEYDKDMEDGRARNIRRRSRRKQNDETPEDKLKKFLEIKEGFRDRIYEHLRKCSALGVTPKFLVTYDSFKHFYDAINLPGGPGMDPFYVVIDEFQSIFLDSYFKADVELDLLGYLNACPRVLFLSATPMLDRYLDNLVDFKDLPYYELVWTDKYVQRVKIDRLWGRSLNDTVSKKFIEKYKSGIFPYKLLPDGTIVQSKELVIFCNSVTLITQIISRNNLKPEEVNVICSESDKNALKLKKVGIEEFGKIPLRGGSHKMFTFCTRTAYLGADFYSTCASTVILGDPNIDSLALDITLDLPQIIGRQRLKENIFKCDITMIYKSISPDKTVTLENYTRKTQEKKGRTEVILGGYDKLNHDEKMENSRIYKVYIKSKNYEDDYVGVSAKTGYASYNYLVEVADWRAYEVSQVEYQDNISVLKSINDISGLDITVSDFKSIEEEKVEAFLGEFREYEDFEHKMKMYCEFRDSISGNPEMCDILRRRLAISEMNYWNYYEHFGTQGIMASGYREKKLRSGMTDLTKKEKLAEKIYTMFSKGNRYPLKDIKEKLRIIYSELGLSKTPKAVDLEEFFYTKRAKVVIDGVSVHVYEITGNKK